jgi:APA family basic amino acid/polyamine antiporter
MQIALGSAGAKIIAVAITISAIGFISQCALVAPRVYFAMAEDGLFFKKMAWVHPKTRVPVFAIAAQAVVAIVIVLSGWYDEILSYVVWNDFCFFGLTAGCIFILRNRAARSAGAQSPAQKVPGHPVSTAIFILFAAFIVINTFSTGTKQALIGLGITLAGVPVFYLWRHLNTKGAGA